jgi:hypothetical protein
LRRIVTAPETSCRLMWGHPGRCDDRSLEEFLIDALEVESGGGTRTFPQSVPGVRWSALGELRVDPQGGVVVPPAEASPVVDADSPGAVCFDYSGEHGAKILLQHYGHTASRDVAISKVHAARRSLDSTNTTVADFVRRFAMVVNVVVDARKAEFSSGSTCDYLGRVILCNAHLPSVDVELMAESLVHEAIHSLLSMYEVCDPWIIREESLSAESRVRSPWTGSTLSLRTFLQACFVWFGLAHFWAIAQRGSPFKADRIAASLARACSGFLGDPLLTCVSACRSEIAPHVLELLPPMQAQVVDAVHPR